MNDNECSSLRNNLIYYTMVVCSTRQLDAGRRRSSRCDLTAVLVESFKATNTSKQHQCGPAVVRIRLQLIATEDPRALFQTMRSERLVTRRVGE